jgi:hypothetical protein
MLTLKEKENILREQTTDQLKMKVWLGTLLVNKLKQEEDSRAPAAAARLEEEMEVINNILQERQPPDQVVGLRTISLKSKLGV